MDLMLNFGELFTLIVYGQLILEQATLTETDEDLVDGIFDVLLRDFSAQAVDLLGRRGSTQAPVVDDARFERIWQQVATLSGAYATTP